MLKIEGIFDFAGRSRKAHDQAPIADFDCDRIGVGSRSRNLYFVMGTAVGNQSAIEGLPTVLAPSSNEQVFEQFVERSFEVAELEWTTALGQF